MSAPCSVGNGEYGKDFEYSAKLKLEDSNAADS
jgi:hypothetical protein